MSEEISHIAESDIARIAAAVFGRPAKVLSVEEIRQSPPGEIPRVIGCNWNLSYIVSIAGHEGKYVFRFNRQRYGRDDEGILNEERNNSLIATRTNVRVPGIHHVDVSRTLVPTGFIVMDYMIGDDWRFLTHAGNRQTTPVEKEEIARKLGLATAQIHSITRQAESAEAGARRVIHGLDALERVVSNSNCRVTPERIAACRQIVASEPALVLETESWRIGDAGLHLAKADRIWQVSFLCDLEFQGYGDPYMDMAPILCHPSFVWDLQEPLSGNGAGPLAEAYFHGYAQIAPIDRERLSAVAIYAHLGTMCGVAREAYAADEGPGIEEREPPIYSRLLEAIEARGTAL